MGGLHGAPPGPRGSMKLIHVLLLNVVTVAVALVVYDQLSSESPGSPQERASRPSGIDTAALDARLQALEAERVVLSTAGDNSGIFKRLAALEAALGQSPGTDAAPAMDRLPDKTTPADDPPGSMASAGVPSADDVRRFRQLQEAVRREDRVRANKKRIEGALDKLPLNLTKRQRARIHTAYAAFEPRVTEIWTEVKIQARATIEAGGEVDRGEIVASTTEVIQTEFAATLTDIVDHQSDAEAIAQALMPGGRK